MDEREKFIMRAALLYAQAHIDDFVWYFGHPDPANIDVCGDVGEKPTDDEFANLVTVLQ